MIPIGAFSGLEFGLMGAGRSGGGTKAGPVMTLNPGLGGLPGTDDVVGDWTDGTYPTAVVTTGIPTTGVPPTAPFPKSINGLISLASSAACKAASLTSRYCSASFITS